ncbi:aminotransferase class-III [Alkaliphilus metalliredigens QYMF]|uniref:(S)-3-amino-2-methylpropionate transaminase n=1 Tax=Alkaliphilus metalliredigens (strain QYMF) TaxID=293826 RepID=A6TKL9_ALKMQ|nr:aspartate aminotransferase family protein [Alkaliphilus metalliredigens]ABR46737.1 aminotransferase class-III [Alkaliphilus metalliredigens QYMF]
MNDIIKGLEVIQKDDELISLGTRIAFYPLAIKEAKGAILMDYDGNEIIDFLSAACVSNVGHSHPRVVNAIIEQTKKFIHYNPAYAVHEQMGNLAEELIRITPGDFPKRVAFSLSGGDANDNAIKVARSYTKRTKVISYFRAYHGTTYGALSLSAVSLPMRRDLGPFVPDVYHIPYPDCYRCNRKSPDSGCNMDCMEKLKELFNTVVPAEEVAAIFLEPFQGDSGVIEPPAEYIEELVKVCKDNGILLVVDEVQSGFGRTGKWFASEHYNLEPDIIVLGKSIASGMPLAALVARKEILEGWGAPAGSYSTAGNPICCAAALATIDIIEEEGLVKKAEELGNYTIKRFEEMKEKHPLIGDIRGKGLMIGVDLVKDRGTKERAKDETAKVSYRCWEKGLFITFFSGNVLRIAPPLTISKKELDKALDIIEEALCDVEAGRVPDEILESVKGW